MADELTCILNVMNPFDYVDCLASATNDATFLIIYYGLLAIFIGGWSLGLGLNKGLLVGGFVGSLVGIGFFALKSITIVNVLFGIILFLAGAFLTYEETKRG